MADARLSQHIEKGNEDGLFISSVASCQNLWALIMDAGTGFTSQVYELSPYFLHKVLLVTFDQFEAVVLVDLMNSSTILHSCPHQFIWVSDVSFVSACRNG